MRVGVAGVGRIGTMHAELIATQPAVTDLVVFDPAPGRGSQIVARLGGSSVETVEDLASSGLDAVVIATSTASHADLVERFCELDVAVFCEKPVAMDVQRTLQVVRAQENSGTLVQVGFQRRFDPGYVELRRQTVEGDLGEVRRMHLVSADPAPPPAAFIATSGGIFRDLLVHDFDLLRWVTGREVAEVWATGSNRGARWFADCGDVDEAVAMVTMVDGTLASIHGSRYNGAGYDVRMEVAGTLATSMAGLGMRWPITSSEPDTALVLGPAWTLFSDRFATAYQAELTAFLEVAKNGGTSPCSVRDGLEALLIAEAADLALRSGERVRLDDIRQGYGA